MIFKRYKANILNYRVIYILAGIIFIAGLILLAYLVMIILTKKDCLKW